MAPRLAAEPSQGAGGRGGGEGCPAPLRGVNAGQAALSLKHLAGQSRRLLANGQEVSAAGRAVKVFLAFPSSLQTKGSCAPALGLGLLTLCEQPPMRTTGQRRKQLLLMRCLQKPKRLHTHVQYPPSLQDLILLHQARGVNCLVVFQSPSFPSLCSRT